MGRTCHILDTSSCTSGKKTDSQPRRDGREEGRLTGGRHFVEQEGYPSAESPNVHGVALRAVRLLNGSLCMDTAQAKDTCHDHWGVYGTHTDFTQLETHTITTVNLHADFLQPFSSEDAPVEVLTWTTWTSL
ncbi:hypothetical protein DPX16_10925 [Anabarilius grahami]|uniref:Uncharacterized protein n=1 Tax=Anabarilius grahami TaxID=495550 RepID=A0A3N0XUN4_ANAGA|nr:hypothetical protein DPX16_10925 [Anabarilius grahami]